MKIKRNKGFSLAEVLISLTVVSLVIAAAAPIFTKKSHVGDESWHWTRSDYTSLQNGTVYNGEMVLVGTSKSPLLNELMKSKDTNSGTYYSTMYPQVYGARGENFIAGADTLSKKGKLTISKNRMDRNGFGQNFVDSHIALYNSGGNSSDVQYVGRLTSDQYNLAFGLGSLQSLNSSGINLSSQDYKWEIGESDVEHFNYNVHGVENTAIGHYAMAKLTGINSLHSTESPKTYKGEHDGGDENTALGYNAMYDNEIGSQNTAIGYNALAKTIKLKKETDSKDISYNTVIGNSLGFLNMDYSVNSSTDIISGARNVIVGNYSDKVDTKIYLPSGERIEPIVAIGSLARYEEANNQSYKSESAINYVRRRFGNGNVFIGHNAGRGLPLYDANTRINPTVESQKHKTTIKTLFNTGDYKNPLYENIVAIGNVDTNAENINSDQRVELIQIKYDDDAIAIAAKEKLPRKVVINGDFTVRSIDGQRTIFKVDASGVPISYHEGHASMTQLDGGSVNKGTSGPTRCEGAEICIGKFSVPKPDGSMFLFNGKDYVNDYDVYIRTMAVGYDRGSPLSISGMKMIPYLKTALLHLDRFKDTNGAVINFLNRDDSISSLLGGFGDFLEAIFGLSDARLKNIYGDSKIGLKEIDALKIKNYTYKSDKSKTLHVGVIAQELKKVFPNSVHEGTDGYLSITQEEMFYGLIKSIQELSSKNNQIEEKILLTEEKIKITNEQNDLLEKENKLLEKQNKEVAKRIAELKKNK